MALNSEGQARNILARKAINTNQDYIDAYVFWVMRLLVLLNGKNGIVWL